jgi:hypothetical protein
MICARNDGVFALAGAACGWESLEDSAARTGSRLATIHNLKSDDEPTYDVAYWTVATLSTCERSMSCYV